PTSRSDSAAARQAAAHAEQADHRAGQAGRPGAGETDRIDADATCARAFGAAPGCQGAAAGFTADPCAGPGCQAAAGQAGRPGTREAGRKEAGRKAGCQEAGGKGTRQEEVARNGRGAGSRPTTKRPGPAAFFLEALVAQPQGQQADVAEAQADH